MMSHDPYVLAAIAALFVFAVYRRFRRLFARQALQPSRLKVRVVVLAIVAGLFAFSGLNSPNFGAALLGGVAFGAVLAWFGLRLTRFEVTPGGIFYTPSGYIGIVLAALLLSRLAYRFVVLYPTLEASKAETGNPFAMYQSSPLTVALLGVVIGYYMAYCIGLVIRGAELRESAPRVAQLPDAASPPSAP